MSGPERVRSQDRKRKPATVTPKLAAARLQQGNVFRGAWARAKAAGRKRPDATDISAARVELGLNPKGTTAH